MRDKQTPIPGGETSSGREGEREGRKGGGKQERKQWEELFSR